MTETSDRREPQKSRGGALVIVLWSVGVLGLIAASLASNARIDVETARLEEARLVGETAAENGLRIGIRLWDTGYDFSAQRDFRCGFDGGMLIIRAVPANARLDINASSEQTLTQLLVGLGEPTMRARSIAAAIIDYRDPDATPRPAGAEAASYRGMAGLPKNRPFRHVNELSLVLGLAPEVFDRIRPHVTVHAETAALDLDHANPTLLEIVTGRLAAGASGGQETEIGTGDETQADLSARRSRTIIVSAATRTDTGRWFALEGIFGPEQRAGTGRLRLSQRRIELSTPPQRGQAPRQPCW